MRTFLKTCVVAPFLKMHPDVIAQTCLTWKFLKAVQSRFTNFRTSKVWNVTLLDYVKLKYCKKKHRDFSQEKKRTERKDDTVLFLSFDSIVRDHRSLRYKIPSIDFCYRSSFADASVAKSFWRRRLLRLRILMMKHLRNDAVIFGCTPWVNFHNVAALFQMNSQEWSNDILALISLDVKYTLSVGKFVSRWKAGELTIETILCQIAMPG